MGKFGNKLDNYFMNKTVDHWKNKYSRYSNKEREQMFTSTPKVSKTHPGNMQKVIMNYYKERLEKFDLKCDE